MSHVLMHAGRRQFLNRAAALSAAAGTPFLGNLLAVGGAAAQSVQPAGDYRALVCVFLAGGNDQSNTVVPVSASAYAAYQAARPSLALPPSQLLPISPLAHNGPALAFNGALSALKPLFDQQRVALVANVGTLVAPLTLAQWNNGVPTQPVPYQLFSHADQQGAWQTGLPDRPSSTGWLGRVGDLLAPSFNAGSGLSVAMSLAGNNMMVAGDSTVQYQLTTDGAVRVWALNDLYGSAAGGTALRRLMSDPRAHLFESELTRVSARAINTEGLVSAALAGVNLASPFPATGLGAQLAMVARMVGARGALAQRRQIFFVQAGGYDFHDDLLADQGARLRELGDAMAAFYRATAALGVAGNVTTFTASDFGRALQHNGRGSDHGWGSHHFVLGGAVLGRRAYGQFPTVALGGPEDAGQGRLIPGVAVDEYTATLARWFGVPDSLLSTVLPNIGRFARRNLGFMG